MIRVNNAWLLKIINLVFVLFTLLYYRLSHLGLNRSITYLVKYGQIARSAECHTKIVLLSSMITYQMYFKTIKLTNGHKQKRNILY